MHSREKKGAELELTWLHSVLRDDDALLQRKKEKRKSKRCWQCSSSGREAGRHTSSERFTHAHTVHLSATSGKREVCFTLMRLTVFVQR